MEHSINPNADSPSWADLIDIDSMDQRRGDLAWRGLGGGVAPPTVGAGAV